MAGEGLVSRGAIVVELRILGTLQLSAPDGRDLASLARQSKRTALLCYLAAAVPDGLHRRDTLLALFWPELDEPHARAALSQALYVLRNELGEQAILTRGDDEVGLSRDVVWCDVRAFEAALDTGRQAEALALYRGGLLDGFYVSDAPEFERWTERERERLRERAAEGAWALADAHSAAKDVSHAVRWARWAAALSPADETVIRRLMIFLRHLGDRAAALRAYEVFAEKLSQEFELEPSAETRALAEEIRTERQPVAKLASPQPSPTVAPALEATRDRTNVPWAGLVGVIAGIALVAILGLRAITAHDATTIRRIAVLPLQNLTGDSTRSYFVDGMHEAIIDELAKLAAVQVISRTSVLGFRGAPQSSLPGIAKQLGVDAVVEGSVFQAGDSVRVAIQLIDGRTDQHLWSETYVRDVHDVLRLYGDLATDVAGQISVTVSPEERARLASARQVDPEVYTLSLKGSHECLLWNDGNPQIKESHQRGIQLLRRAVDRDATYAVAYANLAGCYLDASYFGLMPDSEAAPLAQAANQKAFQLDSTLGEAYLNRGWIRFAYQHDRDGSDRDFRRAVELSPGDVRTRQWYADYLSVTGRFEEAIDQKRKAISLDPLSAESSIGLGAAYFWARRYDDAIAQFKVTLHMAPGSLGARMQLAWNYSLKGMHEVAVAQCDSALTFSPHSEKDTLDTCGWVYATAGRRTRVLEMLRRTSACDNYEVYAALGELERALECIRKRIRENPQDLALENFSPRLDPLRSDPRSRAQLRKLGID